MENLFDINHILKHSFVACDKVMHEKKIELIFDVNTTIPRELRGKNMILEQLLISVLGFVLQSTRKHEIILALDAPEDFLFEEEISFVISQAGIVKEKVLAFLETELGHSLIDLNGKIVYDENDIHLAIPSTIGELGFRRHYRLPLKSMLGKKVLILVKSESLSQSMVKMFHYFSYDVDSVFHKESMLLTEYDLVMIEDNLVTEHFIKLLRIAIANVNLRYVLVGNQHGVFEHDSDMVDMHLIKPVTQESVFELIVSLFAHDTPHKKKKIVMSQTLEPETKSSNVSVTEDVKIKSEDQSIHHLIEEKKSQHVEVLDTKLGLENAKKKGLIYSKELENFLEIFNKSDLYFRQIVNEKQTNKIKDFCIDLEKQAKIIGAESILKFSDTVSLIFVYDKLDMLPIYPGRYHAELTKLTAEIKKL